MNALRVAVLLLVSAIAACFAEGTNALPTTITVDGITYSNVTWRTITPATVSITHRTGAASIPLWKLTPELQAQFGYDLQKATDYIAAIRRAEAARQEALSKQHADEAERQRQAAEIAAAVTATNQAMEAAARKAEQENEVHYGPVTQLRFSYANAPEQLPNGNYSTNLIYADPSTGESKRIYVEFAPEGLNHVRTWLGGAGGNGWSVYGRPYTAHLQNGYGAQTTETAYWLLGSNVNTYSGATTW